MRQYDLIFGIGGSCRCSMGLREGGVQYLSFPMDWHPGPDFVGKCATVAEGFAHWLDRDKLVLLNPDEKEGLLVYKNTETGYTFLHDFLAKQSFDEQYPKIAEKYNRRISRLMGLIEGSSRILVVWVNVPSDDNVNWEKARAGQKVLSNRWPEKKFDILFLNHSENVPFAAAEEEERGQVRMVSFDYRDRSPGEDTWMADQYILGKWFMREYRVDDYRTPEEIAAWKRKEKNYEYDRWHAKNVYQWMRNKIEYKLYVHLRKQLKRRGII